jgi:non-heme chloroperoxidase
MATIEVWRSQFPVDHRESLRQVTVPALVVHGTADQSARNDVTGRRTAELIPGRVYKEYPNAGHGLFVTHADQLNTDILEFIEN